MAIEAGINSISMVGCAYHNNAYYLLTNNYSTELVSCGTHVFYGQLQL